MEKIKQLSNEIESMNDTINEAYNSLMLKQGRGFSSKTKSNYIDMNKSELEKLSKDQLVELLLKQEAKKPKNDTNQLRNQSKNQGLTNHP